MTIAPTWGESLNLNYLLRFLIYAFYCRLMLVISLLHDTIITMSSTPTHACMFWPVCLSIFTTLCYGQTYASSLTWLLHRIIVVVRYGISNLFILVYCLSTCLCNLMSHLWTLTYSYTYACWPVRLTIYPHALWRRTTQMTWDIKLAYIYYSINCYCDPFCICLN